MNVERTLPGVGGSFVLVSVLLAHFHSPFWLFLTGFVGLNLLQSAFTNRCPMMSILKRVGVKDWSEGTIKESEV